jgi:hypothetical protein
MVRYKGQDVRRLVGAEFVAPEPNLPLAACRRPGSTPRCLFPARGESSAPAKAVCGACPELERRRSHALALPPIARGIFGGLSQPERRRARRSLQEMTYVDNNNDGFVGEMEDLSLTEMPRAELQRVRRLTRRARRGTCSPSNGSRR